MSQVDFSHVTFISAGAGSGKTYRLTQDLQAALVEDGINPARVIGTTFTVKAAGELKERVRGRLIQAGRLQLAEQMAQALIGTVHSVCERLLKRFSFELGLSPELNVMSIEDGNRLFNQALDEVLSLERVREMNALAMRLGQEDWQAAVKQVADKVRENDLGADDLPLMARDSADALLALFPAEVPGDHLSALKNAVREGLEQIDPGYDTTQKTRKYLGLLRQAHHQLRRNRLAWSEWVKLSAEESAKKSADISASVREAAGRYAVAPEFHRDLRVYVEGVMEIAGLALEQFQNLKTDRGLIDFLDMEQLMLRALDEPAVSTRIGDELELLMVDEFQDTNPMQLALFVKLATLADRAIFVGDVKQAIYAFRGCDPDLVFRTLEGMAGASATTDKLERNWRSRPGLVHYVNEVFARAFAADGIGRGHVELKPERDDKTGETAVLGWTLAGENKEDRAQALAQGISELVLGGFQVVDPETNEARNLRWGDVAVLARTNDNVELIARTLKDRRVPMKMTLSGLLATPEVCLARACLRRLNDPTDTLATAEILSLCECADPEDWLSERLDWVAGDEDNYRWGEDTHPVISRLVTLRQDSALRSPLEIVARVLNDIGTRRIVIRWGSDAVKAAQRQRNLDAFLKLAVDYESHAESQHSAATLTGFLFWLENPSSPELDLQPMVTSGDAVHVLTYHRAKGLEWPVVIASDFDKEDRSSLWDVRVNLTAEFDVLQPLANRTIRFWPNVFGKRTKNLPVLDHILSSEEGLACEAKSASEQRRLAYVGLTRARDALAIALPAKVRNRSTWLSSFESDVTVPGQDRLALPNGVVLRTATSTLDGHGDPAPPLPFAPRWFPQRERREHLLKEVVSPSSAQSVEGLQMAEAAELGERMPLHGGDMTAVGSALHAVIAAEMVNPGSVDESRARGILEAYRVDAFVKAEDAALAARRLQVKLREKFGPAAKLVAECPVVRVLDDGRVVRGFVDLLLQTDDAWVVIDHKSSPRPRSEWAEEAREYSGQLAAYGGVLAELTAKDIQLFLHFPVSAGLVRVERVG